jgi:hypothetical protein
VLWQLIERFYAEKPAPAMGSPELRSVANRYVGTYLPLRRAYSGLEGFVRRLQAQVTVTVSADGFLVMAPAGLRVRFVPATEPGVLQSVDVPSGVAFEPRDGSAERLITVAIGMERAGFVERTGTLFATAGTTAIVALFVLVAFVANRKRAGLASFPRFVLYLRAAAASAWLLTLVAFATAMSTATGNPDAVVFDWPMPSVIVFSASALLAGILSAATLLSLPGIWRTPAWRAWRKLRFGASVLVFSALTAVLAYWGALEPWRT